MHWLQTKDKLTKTGYSNDKGEYFPVLGSHRRPSDSRQARSRNMSRARASSVMAETHERGGTLDGGMARPYRKAESNMRMSLAGDNKINLTLHGGFDVKFGKLGLKRVSLNTKTNSRNLAIDPYSNAVLRTFQKSKGMKSQVPQNTTPITSNQFSDSPFNSTFLQFNEFNKTATTEVPRPKTVSLKVDLQFLTH